MWCVMVLRQPTVRAPTDLHGLLSWKFLIVKVKSEFVWRMNESTARMSHRDYIHTQMPELNVKPKSPEARDCGCVGG